MIPARERLIQIARLIGVDRFTRRFGSPQAAEPELDELRALIDQRLDRVAQALVEEAAASDDVIDRATAASYLEDRLRTLGDVLTDEQARRIGTAFRERTSGW